MKIKWISVKDSMPHDREKCLVVIWQPAFDKWLLFIGFFLKDRWILTDRGEGPFANNPDVPHRVDAWMYLKNINLPDFPDLVERYKWSHDSELPKVVISHCFEHRGINCEHYWHSRLLGLMKNNEEILSYLFFKCDERCKEKICTD